MKTHYQDSKKAEAKKENIMVLVTDKQYYMQENMKALMDLCIKRAKKNWDNCWVIDGLERVGKSLFSTTLGYYYAQQTGAPFSHENYFFDPEEMYDFASRKEKQVIVFDEAAFVGLAKMWQSKVQQKLNVLLMTAGTYGHFWIFICPSFFELNKYLAVHRSMGLINVYSPDMISRGFYRVFSRVQKAYAYNNLNKTMSYGQKALFTGDYHLPNTDKLIDWAKYEVRKREAIRKFATTAYTVKDQKFMLIRYQLATKIPPRLASAITGFNESAIAEWKVYGKHLDIAEKSVKPLDSDDIQALLASKSFTLTRKKQTPTATDTSPKHNNKLGEEKSQGKVDLEWDA